MSEQDRHDPAEDHGYTSHAGSIWAPKNIAGGLAGVGMLSLVLGVVSLVLALLDSYPLLTFLLAVIGLITGLRVFLPRVTTMDKVLIAVGTLASLATMVILLLRISDS